MGHLLFIVYDFGVLQIANFLVSGLSTFIAFTCFRRCLYSLTYSYIQTARLLHSVELWFANLIPVIW